jgi:hypothetical protein
MVNASFRPLLLVFVVLAATVGCGRLHEHPLVIEAVEEVRLNPRVAETLGAPVACSRTVRGTANETDGIAHLEFEATGATAAGLIIVEGKKTRGEWGMNKLVLQPSGGVEVSLIEDLLARTGTDTPAFDPAAAAAKPSTAPPPPGEIEIVLPPGPPGQ